MEIDRHTESSHYAAQVRLATMDNYHRWILANLAQGLGSRVWDAGAGIGLVSGQIVGRVEKLLATEYTEGNLEVLRTAFGGVPGVEVERCDLNEPQMARLKTEDFDTIINLDVLEHLKDDQRVLELFWKVLAPGGHLLLKVPAHEFLFGTMDEASLHYRRYGKQELASKLREAGFEIVRLRHMNLAAILPYFLKGRILRKKSNFSRAISSSRLGVYNRIIPILKAIEDLVPPPMGLSLIAIARKPVV